MSARGSVPRFCVDHRAANLPGSSAERAAAAPDPEPAPEPVDDGFPRRVAPVVWADQMGRMYRDLAAAQRACEEWRRGRR